MKKVSYLKLVVLITITFILNVAGQNKKDLQLLEHKNFKTQSAKQFTLATESGSVEITRWHNDEVEINIYGNKNAKEKMEFSFSYDNNSISVKGERKKGWGLFSNMKLKYEIKIPENFNSDISTAGGDIKVGGINGEIRLNTSGGDIWADRISGNLIANTSGGDIKIYSDNASIDARTSGGDISLEYSGVNKGIELRTSGGDIEIKLPNDFNADVQLETSGGDVECDFKLNKVEKYSRSKIIGVINSGGQKLVAKTSGGDITVSGR
jgi:DUF4097 and DUF4098 domain-containing protein YvlB